MRIKTVFSAVLICYCSQGYFEYPGLTEAQHLIGMKYTAVYDKDKYYFECLDRHRFVFDYGNYSCRFSKFVFNAIVFSGIEN